MINGQLFRAGIVASLSKARTSFAPASPTAKEPFRDTCGIAASLSKAHASFAPASPTAKEPFRDACSIPHCRFALAAL